MVQEVVTQWLQSDSDYLLSSAIEAVLPEIVRWVSCEDLSADWENPLYWVIGILLEHRGRHFRLVLRIFCGNRINMQR